MPKGLSLHIGLNRVDPNHYQGWDGRLVACEADARAMSEIAVKQGYTSRMLLTQQATAAAVLGALQDAARQLDAGDILFLTYSGHGGQVPDTGGDESEGQDETWVLHDRMLLDDELYAQWEAFKPGVRIVVLSDSCHSGTAVRLFLAYELRKSGPRGPLLGPGGSGGVRAIPDELALHTFKAHGELYREVKKKLAPGARERVAASIILISGCQDDQLSFDGPDHGLFTSKLLSVWKAGGSEGNYRSFHERICGLMPPYQKPNLFTAGTANPMFLAERPFSITGMAPKHAAAVEGLLPRCTIVFDTDQSGLESMSEEFLEDLICGQVRRTAILALGNARRALATRQAAIELRDDQTEFHCSASSDGKVSCEGRISIHF